MTVLGQSEQQSLFPSMNLSSTETKIFKKLNTPQKIQDFLNSLPLNFEDPEETCYSPRVVLQKNTCHCMEGAMLGAAILQFHKHKPLVMDLKTNGKDDDHIVALFKINNHWGALSKTNHSVLRYREPVYKTLRELAMSYFHEYFTDDGKKVMRSYSIPIDVSRFDTIHWITSEQNLWEIPQYIDSARHIPIITTSMIAQLRKADGIEIKAGKLREWRLKNWQKQKKQA